MKKQAPVCVVIMMGLPGRSRLHSISSFFFFFSFCFFSSLDVVGSGKSTFAANLAKKAKIEVFARDELGSTDAVKKALEKALKKQKKSAIVDCVNMHPKDRIMWATVARQLDPACKVIRVFVDTPKELCIERAMSRKNHPTLSPENAVETIEMFGKGFKEPTSFELGKMGKYEYENKIVDDESAKTVTEELLKILI